MPFFVWARRALNRQKRRFPDWAVAASGQRWGLDPPSAAAVFRAADTNDSEQLRSGSEGSLEQFGPSADRSNPF
jgi:hypothetical protein